MAAKKDFSISDYIVHGVYFTLYGLVKYFPAPLGNILRYWVSKPFLAFGKKKGIRIKKLIRKYRGC